MFNRLYLNLFFIFSMLIVATVLAIGFYIEHFTQRFYLDFIREDMADDAGFLNDEFTGRAVLHNNKEYLNAIVARAETDMQIAIFDRKGALLAKTGNGTHSDFTEGKDIPELESAMAGETTYDVREDKIHDETIYLAVPIRYQEKIVGALDVSHNLSFLRKKMRRITKRVLVASSIAVGVALLASIYFSYNISKPILNMSRIAESVSRGDFSQRVNVKNKDEIKKLATSFNSMTEQLKELEESKRDFIANTSHELMTPLTSIRGFVETLLKGAVKKEKEAREFLMIIKKQSEYLEYLIKELLLLSKMEASEIKFDFKKVSLVGIVKEVAKIFLFKMQAKAVAFETDIPYDIPLINADEKSLRQAIGNLLDNAIKHTPSGGRISLSAERIDDSVRISVKDSGEGIPEQELDKIFKRFYRVDKSRSKDGAGLGLAIVKHIVNAHHGRISVTSRLHEGSVFHIILPI